MAITIQYQKGGDWPHSGTVLPDPFLFKSGTVLPDLFLFISKSNTFTKHLLIFLKTENSSKVVFHFYLGFSIVCAVSDFLNAVFGRLYLQNDIYIVWGWIDISSEDVTYFHRVWLQNWICNIVERYNDFPDLSEQYPAQRIKRESETFPEVFWSHSNNHCFFLLFFLMVQLSLDRFLWPISRISSALKIISESTFLFSNNGSNLKCVKHFMIYQVYLFLNLSVFIREEKYICRGAHTS